MLHQLGAMLVDNNDRNGSSVFPVFNSLGVCNISNSPASVITILHEVFDKFAIVLVSSVVFPFVPLALSWRSLDCQTIVPGASSYLPYSLRVPRDGIWPLSDSSASLDDKAILNHWRNHRIWLYSSYQCPRRGCRDLIMAVICRWRKENLPREE